MSLLDRLDKLENAPVFRQSKYIEVEGKFLCQVDAIAGNTGEKGEAFIINYSILESSHADVAVGDSFSSVIILDKPGDANQKMALSNVKAFMFALLGVAKTPKDGDPMHKEATAIAKACVSEDYAKQLGVAPGFLHGKQIRLQTIIKPQKQNPSEMFTHMNWSPA
jgi:hypothetical protein